MLIRLNIKNEVISFNSEISKEAAKRLLSNSIVWVDSELPKVEEINGFIPVLMYSQERGLYYFHIEEIVIFTKEELQMQLLADIQLENLQAQAERQVLGQTLAEMELLLMGGITNV